MPGKTVPTKNGVAPHEQPPVIESTDATIKYDVPKGALAARRPEDSAQLGMTSCKSMFVGKATKARRAYRNLTLNLNSGSDLVELVVVVWVPFGRADPVPVGKVSVVLP